MTLPEFLSYAASSCVNAARVVAGEGLSDLEAEVTRDGTTVILEVTDGNSGRLYSAHLSACQARVLAAALEGVAVGEVRR